VDFQLLGEGGMGVVYLALDTSLNRRVALKMVRAAGGASNPLDETPTETPEEIQARFLREAAVTGGLEHPGIVPVYELGLTRGGTPYYTMRVVRGRRTLEDAIAAASTPEQRLALLEPFLKVCDTMAFAHARGVIHRDLKPANIALGEYGEVVVLDWGLAKVREQPDLLQTQWQSRLASVKAESDLKTLTSAMGTPGYMAPEAALGQSAESDERSDVYSLGAMLYRILSGRLPHSFTNFVELASKLLSEDPEPPPDAPQGLQGICLRALAREKTGRFANAGDLASAARAWQTESALEREVSLLLKEAEGAWGSAATMTGEALLGQLDRIVAVCDRIERLRPGHTGAVRLLARVRDRRDGAIAQREAAARRRVLKRAAVVGLALATAATVVVAFLLDGRRREAEAARAKEAVERARAEELAGFMLFDLRDGLEPIGRLDLLGKVALRSKEYYDSLPSENVTPEVLRNRGVALNNVGHVLKARGDLEGALSSYRESLAIGNRLAVQDPSNPGWQADLSFSLGFLGDVLRERGDLEGALASYRESVERFERLVAQDPLNAAWQRELSIRWALVGGILQARGDLEGALSIYRESIAIGERLVAQDPSDSGRQRDLAVSRDMVGDILMERGDLEGALAMYRASLAVRERLVAKDPSNAGGQRALSVSRERVGDILIARGELEGALASYRESLAIAERLAAQDASNAGLQRDLSIKQIKVGDILNARGDREGALAGYRESVAIAERLVAQDPSNAGWQRDLSVGRMKVGEILHARGDLEGALSSYRESLAIGERLVAQDPSSSEWERVLVVSYYRVAAAEKARGAWAEALQAARNGEQTHAEAVRRNPQLEGEHHLWVTLRQSIELLGGFRTPEGAAEHLALAYALYERKEFAKSAERFASALADETSRADLDRANLYNGACSAALAGPAWRESAFRWLGENLRLRHEALARVDTELGGNLPAGRKAQLESARQAILAHLERARVGDTDLASLRGCEEFDALFR